MLQRFERQVTNDVPIYWAEVPGPLRAALVFRVGRADEALSRSGLTHLVEHLALSRPIFRNLRGGGLVDGSKTVFHVTGTEEEVGVFFSEVCSALTDLPLDRLAQELEILKVEGSQHESGLVEDLLTARFGAESWGSLGYPELGLNRVVSDDITGWAAQHFVRNNASMWFSGPHSAPSLSLGSGIRSQLPSIAPVEGLNFPAWMNWGRPFVAISWMVERSVAATGLLRILNNRLVADLRHSEGIAYSPRSGFLHLAGHSAHVLVMADCLEKNAGAVRNGMLDALNDLAENGPDDKELETLASDYKAAWSDPFWMLGDLDQAAADELFGPRPSQRDELLAEVENLRPTDVAGEAGSVMASALMMLPGSVEANNSTFNRIDLPNSPVSGQKFRRSQATSENAESRLIVGDEGVSVAINKTQTVTVKHSECAAALRWDTGELLLISRDASQIRLDPSQWRHGKSALELAEKVIPEDVVIPMEAEDQKDHENSGPLSTPVLIALAIVAWLLVIGGVAAIISQSIGDFPVENYRSPERPVIGLLVVATVAWFSSKEAARRLKNLA